MLFGKFKKNFRQGLLVILLSIIFSFVLFLPAKAADYNCGAYGAGSYQNATCAATTDQDGGELGNTGQSSWKILLGAGLILAGVCLLIGSRRQAAKAKARKRESEASARTE